MSQKRIEEMSDLELLALTDEQIERFVKLRMAEEGIPLYPEPEKPELEKVEGPVDEFFFSERYFNGIGFRNADQLRDIINQMKSLKCVRRKKDWSDPAGHFETNICKHDYADKDDIEITSEKLYSRKAFKLSKEVLKENKKRTDEYEHERKKVRDSRQKAQDIRDEVCGPIRRAETRKYQCEQADRNMVEYLDLADGDVNQAWKFFEKAYNPDEHVEEYLRAKHNITCPSIHDEKPAEEEEGDSND